MDQESINNSFVCELLNIYLTSLIKKKNLSIVYISIVMFINF